MHEVNTKSMINKTSLKTKTVINEKIGQPRLLKVRNLIVRGKVEIR